MVKKIDYVDVNIRKPVYGTYCYIRDKYIRQAKLHGVSLRITIPQGIAIVSPDDWLKGSQVMKKVFLQPDNPMILYGNRVPIETEQKDTVIKEEEKEEQLSLF